MKAKFFLLCCMLTMMFVSCTTPKKAVRQLSNLAEDVRNNSVNYDVKDWGQALKKYKAVNGQIVKYTLNGKYSAKQINEIARIQGECTAEMAKGAGKGLIQLGGSIKSFLEGFKSSLDL